MPDAYPVQKVNTSQLDQGKDSPAEARLALYDAVQKLNQMIGSFGEALGVCPLNAQARIPSEHLEGAIRADAIQPGSITPEALASDFALPVAKGGTGGTSGLLNTDLQYKPLTGGTVALRQSVDGNYTYNINNFQGNALQASQIRGLHIHCSAVSAQPSSILATMPNGSKYTICLTTGDGRSTTGQAALMAFMPIDAGQSSLEIEIRTTSFDTTANVSFQIVGATLRILKTP